MNYKQVFTSLLGLTIGLVASAQVNLPTMKVGDKLFYYYKLENKETVSNLAKKFNVDNSSFTLYNTGLEQSVPKNKVVLYPVPEVNNEAEVKCQVKATDKDQVLYTLVEGDDLYTVAKRFNASVESIVRNNVNVAPTAYVSGITVKVNPNTAEKMNYSIPITTFGNYIVVGNETMYSIASSRGITVDELMALNPGVTNLKKKMKLTVPVASSIKKSALIKDVPLSYIETSYRSVADATYKQLRGEMSNIPVNVGVMLPFQLQNPNPPRQAFLYTDFLKGLLLAVDSIGSNASRKMNIKVFDTQHNLNVTDSLLALPEMRDLHFIIAPSEPKQLERITAFGEKNGVKVLNCFSTKNDDYKEQVNSYIAMTPTSTMVENLAGWFKNRFPDATIVYLMDKAAEPSDMFKSVKSELGSYPSVTINVDGELPYATVDHKLDPGTNYVFIPSTGSKALLKKVLPALKKAKTERVDCAFNLIGYPEYVLHLKECQNDMMAVDTYMFSRFFNAKGFRTRNVEASYSKKYEGDTMIGDTYPVMALYGFDTGSFLINTLGACLDLDDNTPVQKGIQTGFLFTHEEGWQGFVNQAITLVHFNTDKKIETFVVTNKK